MLGEQRLNGGTWLPPDKMLDRQHRPDRDTAATGQLEGSPIGDGREGRRLHRTRSRLVAEQSTLEAPGFKGANPPSEPESPHHPIERRPVDAERARRLRALAARGVERRADA